MSRKRSSVQGPGADNKAVFCNCRREDHGTSQLGIEEAACRARVGRETWLTGVLESMNAKLATVDDHALAGVEEASVLRDGNIPGSASDKPPVGVMRFECGYLSPYFVTNPERMEVAFTNPYILIHENKISSRKDLLPLLEQIKKSGKPLLIIAEDVEGEALATLVVNKLRGPLQVAAVKTPSGDRRRRTLQEIALLTGGKTISEGLELQLKNIQISDLGQARKISVHRNNTLIEGRAKYDQLSFDTASSAHSDALTSPAQSLRTGITVGTQRTLSP